MRFGLILVFAVACDAKVPTRTHAAPSASSSIAPSTPAAPLAPMAASDAVPDADARGQLQLAPVLDGARSQQALADYRRPGRAIASGAVTSAGADEVLLDVESGKDWAAGERALALMRRDGAHYRFVEHLMIGKGFRAVARVVTSSRRDRIMLCEEGGHMGLYQGTCGFLEGRRLRRDLETVYVTTCGPASFVSLGPITLERDVLRVELLVDDLVLVRQAGDEGDFCSRRSNATRRSFVLEYRERDGEIERVTAIPREARPR